MDKKILIYLLPFTTLFVGLIIGFFVGGKMYSGSPVSKIGQAPSLANRLYTSQAATIRGQITAVKDRTIQVRNANGTTGDIKASNRIMIVKFSPDPRNIVSPSSDLQSIETNKDVLMTLEMVNGNYEVIQVQYVVPGPALPSFAPGEL